MYRCPTPSCDWSGDLGSFSLHATEEHQVPETRPWACPVCNPPIHSYKERKSLIRHLQDCADRPTTALPANERPDRVPEFIIPAAEVGAADLGILRDPEEDQLFLSFAHLKETGVTDRALESVRGYVKKRAAWMVEKYAEICERGADSASAFEEVIQALNMQPELQSKYTFEKHLSTHYPSLPVQVQTFDASDVLRPEERRGFKSVKKPKDDRECLQDRALRPSKSISMDMFYINLNDWIRMMVKKHPTILDEARQFRDFCLADDAHLHGVPSGSEYQSKRLFREHPSGLALALYFDEVQARGPLGAYSLKIGVVQVVILNVPSLLFNRVDNIGVIGLVSSKLLKLVGPNLIFSPFTTDLRALYEGIVLEECEPVITVYGLLLCFLGDNDASQIVGGFGTSSSDQPCRQCEVSVSKETLNISPITTLEQSYLRTHRKIVQTANHIEAILESQNLQTLEAARYSSGIFRKSWLQEIPEFQMDSGLPQDAMHDIVEGSLYRHTMYFLQALFESKTTDLNEISACMKAVSDEIFSETSVRLDTPADITGAKLENFAHNSMKQMGFTAHKTWIFCQLLPLVLWRLVNLASLDAELRKHVVCYFEHLWIAKRCLQRVIPRPAMVDLESAATKVHKTAGELYPTIHFPKFHYFLHSLLTIKRFGPLRNIWCMTHEDVNGKVKEAANNVGNNKSVLKHALSRLTTWSVLPDAPVSVGKKPRVSYQHVTPALLAFLNVAPGTLARCVSLPHLKTVTGTFTSHGFAREEEQGVYRIVSILSVTTVTPASLVYVLEVSPLMVHQPLSTHRVFGASYISSGLPNHFLRVSFRVCPVVAAQKGTHGSEVVYIFTSLL